MNVAADIVSKIRYNIPEGVRYKQPDRQQQTDTIQKLIDDGLLVLVVKKPIIYYEDRERVLLRTFFIDGDIMYPVDTKVVFIWCWYAIGKEKQFITIGYI